MKNNVISEVEDKKCCGCGACYNKCPVGAITMQENEEGFLHPVIDEEKCTNCGLCIKSCPALNPSYSNSKEPPVYAVMLDDETRMKSSSGGMFTLLTEYILDKGGYVCGAAYDENWMVHHIIIDNKNDLDKLRKSKYLQSRIEDCYKQIKILLESGKYVLFAGTPCQVAGLNKYLDKEYETLLTIDVVCHGVPSPKVFRKFLKENNQNQEIKTIDFREKEVFGWTTPTVIKYKNGEVYRQQFNECPYFRGFLSNLFLNKSCGDCAFNKIPRQGDFTLGDFWWIHEYNPKFDDRKGTGIVLLNTTKAEMIFGVLKQNLKLCEKVPMKFAIRSNPNLVKTFKHHKNRDKFFKYLKNNTYKNAFKYAKGEKYDVCVVGCGWFPNYGAALTSFCLIKTLEDLGLSVLMLDRPVEETNLAKLPPEKDRSRQFALKHLNLSEQYSKLSVHELNDKVDTFITGSDQLWHWNSLKRCSEYYLLQFVHSNRRKIAYATSFGHDTFTAPPVFKYIYSYLLSRFDAISVRETSGLNILKELGVTGQQVLDPVFLCNSEHLVNLANSVKPVINGDYIFSYILDPQLCGNKKKLLLEISKKYNLPLVTVTDMFNEDNYAKELDLPVKNLSIEEFISNLYHSKYVVTDSFHGVCFSIIFRKKFICIGNSLRGIARFESLLTKLGLLDRMIYHCDELNNKENLLSNEIDYEYVYKILSEAKEKSLEFLQQVLKIPINIDTPTDAFDTLNIKMWQNLIEMWETNKKLENNNCDKLKLLLNASTIKRKYYRYKILSKILIGEKRKYYKEKKLKFHEKIREIRRFQKQTLI